MSLKITRLEERIVLDGAGASDIVEITERTIENIKAIDGSDDHSASDNDYDSADDHSSLISPLDSKTTEDITQKQPTSILLVSDTLENADQIIQSASDTTLILKYSPSETTADNLLASIDNVLGDKQIENISFACDENGENSLEIASDNTLSISTLAVSEKQQEFWSTIGTHISETGSINLISEGITDQETGDFLEEQVEAASGCSVDITDISDSSDDTLAEVATYSIETDTGNTYTLNQTALESEDFSDITKSVIEDAAPQQDSDQSEGIDIVLIDNSLPDFQTLANAATENTHILFYDGNTQSADSVLEQAASYAFINQENINSVAIMSHGLEGSFKLGNEWIGAEDLADHEDALLALDLVMNDGGNIYLYGCNIAQDTQAGQTLLDALAAATQTDVFASDDLSGAGGDWELEAASTGDEGELGSSEEIFDADELAEYDDSLADYNFTNWSGNQDFTDGAISFNMQVSGGGGIDWSYNGTTDTLTISNTAGTAAGTDIIITDTNGGLTVDTININSVINSLVVNSPSGTIDVNTVNVAAGINVGTITIDAGSGTLNDLNYAGDMSSPVTINGSVGSFDVTGAIHGAASIDVNGSVGSINAVSLLNVINIDGNLGTLSTDSYIGIGSVINVTGDVTSISTASAPIRANITIGGDLGSLSSGHDLAEDCTINVTGHVTSITAAMAMSSDITIGGDLGSLYAGGNLSNSGSLNVAGNVGSIEVATYAENVQGETSTISGNLDTFLIHGDMDGTLDTVGKINTFTIEGNMNNSSLNTGGDIGDLTINGSVLGDIDVSSGKSIDSITVSGGTGSLNNLNYAGDMSSPVTINASVGSIDVTGDINGIIDVNGNVGSIHCVNLTQDIDIDGNLGSLNTDNRIAGTAHIMVTGDITSIISVGLIAGDMTIGGDLGTLYSGDVINLKSIINVTGNVGTIECYTSFSATANIDGNLDTVLIHGNLLLGGKIDVVGLINSYTIEGDLGGFNNGTTGSIGTLTVNGSFSCNNFTIGGDLDSFNVGVDNTGTLTVNNAFGVFDISDGGVFTYNNTFDPAEVVVYTRAGGVENFAPVATDDTVSIAENAANGASVHTVVATDADPDDTLTYTITGGNTDGIFTINSSTGEITVANNTNLNYEATTSYGLTVEVSDGTDTDTATITVNISNINEATVAVDDIVAATEDTPLFIPASSLLANDTDEDGDTLSITSVTATGDTHGTVSVLTSDGSVSTIADETNTYRVIGFSYSDSSQSYNTINYGVYLINGGILRVYENGANLGELGTYETGDVIKIQRTGTQITYLNNDVVFYTSLIASTGELHVDTALNTTGSTLKDVTIEQGGISSAVNFTNVVGVTATGNDLIKTAATGWGNAGAFSEQALDDQSGVLYTPDADYNGPASFEYTVSDGQGGEDTATVTVNVAAVNYAPVAVDDTVSLAEDTANGTSVHTVVATDADPEDTLTYTITGGNADGVFTINSSTGEITVANNTNLNYEATTSYGLTVEVSDGTTSDTATITVNISDINEAPVAVDDIVAATEDTPLFIPASSLLANDTDEDGDTLSITSVTATGDTHGTVSVLTSDGSVSTIADETNTYRVIGFSYSDSSQSYNTINYGVYLINGGILRVYENGTNLGELGTYETGDVIKIQRTGTQITYLNNDVVFYTSLIASTGELHVDTALNTTGSTLKDVTIEQGGISSAVNFTNVVGVTATGNDLIKTAATGWGNAGAFSEQALDDQSGVLYTPDADYNGPASFEYTVSDGQGGEDTATVTVNVAAVNYAPVAVDDTVSLAENTANGTSVHTVVATDADPEDTLTYTITGGNADGVFTINSSTGEITVANNTNLNYEATTSYGLTVEVSDGTITDTATITVNISDINDAPVAVDDIVSLAENTANGTSVHTVAATDVDAGDTLTYSITGGNADGIFAINAATGEITVTNNTNLNYEATTSYGLTVEVSDGTTTDTAAITVNISDINEAPVAVDDTVTATEDTPLIISASSLLTNDTDEDGDPLTITDVTATGDTHGTVSLVTTDGSVSTVIDETDTGRMIGFSYSDLNQSFGTIDYAVGVMDLNRLQVYETGHFIGSFGTYTTGDVIKIERTGTEITYLKNDVVFYTSLTASTGELHVDTSIWHTGGTLKDVTVEQGGITSDVIFTNMVGVTATGNDLIKTAANAWDGGAFSEQALTEGVLFTPDADYNGPASFEYTVSDGQGGEDTATVTVNVQAVNDAPVAVDDTVSLAENVVNGTSVHTVAATDVDTGDTLTYTITGGNADGIFTINSATGEITVANNTNLNYEATTSYGLTVEVSDGTIADTANITVNVTDINEFAPVAVNDTVSLAENAANGTTVHTVIATDADPTDTLTYSITGGNADGIFAINASTGEITVTNNTNLNYEATTSYGLTVEVSDGTNTDTAAITVNVSDINEFAPVATDDTVSLAENSANGTSVHTVVATDADPTDTLTYSITGGNADGIFAINAVTGEITVTNNTNLNYEATTSYGLTVEVSDGTNSDTSNITVNVTDINEFTPVAVDDTVSLAENATNGTTVHTVVATDADPTDTLTYSITGGNADGIFAINASTGEITVTNNTNLNYEATTSYGLTVEVSDGTNTDTAAITVNVSDINEFAPVATDDTVSLAENATNGTTVHTVIATDADPTDTLTYSITGGNADGIFAINASTGEITVANNTNLNYEATTSYGLTVDVSDGTNTDTANITVNVTDINEFAPLAVDDTVSLAENATNGTTVHTVIATDADPTDTLTYSITGGNADGIFAINASTGEITVTNNTNLNYEATTSYGLTVEVSDGTNTDTAAITVNVTDINEFTPVAVDDTVSLAENATNGTTVHTVIATDADPTDTLTYSITGGNADGIFAINASTGEITVTNNTNLNYEATTNYGLTVEVSDGSNTDTAAITVNVTDINEFTPVAVDDTVSLAENATNGTTVHTVIATDADPTDTLTYSITGGNADGIFAINASTGEITVTNNTNLNYEATTSYGLTVEVSDGTNSDTANITVNVTDINEFAPVAVDDTVSLAENSANGTSVHTVVATDADPTDTLTYSITGGNADGIFAINAVTGEITVTNNTNLNYEATTSYGLTVEVSDGTNSDTSNITVNVTDINEFTPVAIDDTVSLAENATNGTTVHTVIATDADPTDTLTYSITGGNADGIFAINASTGEITVTNNTNLNYEATTNYGLTVEVSDGANTDTAAITVNVTDINEFAPIATDDTVSLTENSTNGTSVHTVVATDADPTDTLTYSITGGNADGIFAINASTGEITVTNNTNLNYEATTIYGLTVEVSDGTNTDTAAITVNVTDINEFAPVATDDTVSLAENATNGTTVHTVIATDTDPTDTLTYSITGGNADGIFAINASTGEITVTNNTNLNYEATTNYGLTVEVSDGTNSDTANITVNVTDIGNEFAPVATDDTVSLAENAANGTSVHTVLATDADPTDTLTYSITGGNADGIFAINASTGEITVTNNTNLNYEATTSYGLTVEVSDGTNTDTAAITVNVSDINEFAPVATDDTVSLAENSANGTSVHTVVATDADPTDTLTYSITGGNADGIFAINAVTGEITVTNNTNLNYEATTSYGLTVEVSDGTNSDTSNITVNVTDINEFTPVAVDDTVSLAENATNGTTVHTVIATDADPTDTLTYSITGGNADGIFAINASTGEITVTNNTNLNYEATTSYGLTVEVSDGANTDTAAITVNVSDINEFAPVATDDAVSLDENSANGTSVHTVVATDADPTDTLTYSITGGNADGIFAINASTGEITVANNTNLNYEATTSYGLTVDVSDGTNTDTANITVNVTDINEFAPVAVDDTVSLAENSANGTSVHTVVATDADPTDTLTYSITGGNADGIFAINAVTGEITVTNNTNLNYEATTSYGLTVEVSDGANTDTAAITVNVTDINEFAPIATDDTVSLAENSTNGTSVHTVVATDADPTDTLTYTITGGNTDNIFAINASTGEITIADNTNLDMETTTSYGLTVQVSDGTNNDSATITVNVTDINEFAPVATDNTASITENAANGTSVHTVVATDADATATLNYSITGGNTDNIFTINAATGEITISDNTNLNYEAVTSYALTVQVSDGTNNDTATITVDVTDINESAPVAVNDTVSLAENSANGTSVHTVVATDADATATLTYSITGGNTDTIFAINASTGEITVSDNTNLNYEAATNYALTVQVSDGTYTDTATITVNVTDINEFAPVATDDTLSIAENAANGTSVHTVVATDADTDAVLNYSITGGNTGNIFAINAATGEITIADNTNLNYEAVTSYALTVQVSDGTNNDTATITVDVTDINEFAPVAVNDTVSLAENATNGTSVHTVVATDADAGATLNYSITGGNTDSIFAINAATGEITVSNNTNLNYEATTNYGLTVQVSDGTNTDTATITVNVTNINEFAPVATDDTLSIAENAANGTSVHTVVATDADTDAVLNYSITGGNTGNIFAINAATGEITIFDNTNLNYEAVTSYALTVQVSDGTNNDTATITVNVTDINEFAPLAVNDTVSLAENSANGTSVHTVVATDADATATLNYSITGGNTDSIFTINASTGEITVSDNTNLNYEATTNYALTVQVSDGTNTDTATITVNVADMNEFVPVAVNDTVSIAENAGNGTSVHTVVATDADASDTLNYSITGGNTGNIFAINAATGEITIADNTNLNYETATSYALTVQVSDGTNNDTATITVNIQDMNEFAPVALNATVPLSEGAANGASVHTVIATDADATATLNYAITGGNTDGVFAINASNGEITIADNTSLDMETTTSYALTVQVSDGTNTDSATITMNVTDMNEFVPVAVNDTVSIAENAGNGTSVHTVVATDADASATLNYSITGGNTDTIFAINAATGEITVSDNTNLNYEAAASYALTVQVSDGANNDTATITINVTDINESVPIALDANVLVDENTANGTWIHTVIATDADATDTLNYSITGGNADGIFTIDATTGEIIIGDNTLLNYESAASYALTVQVSDGTYTNTATITVNVGDINEAPTTDAGSNQTVDEGTYVTLDATNSTDPEGVGLSYTWTQTSGVAVSLSDITSAQPGFTAPEGLVNSDLTFDVTVSDGVNTSTDSVTVSVNADNDAPVAEAGINQWVFSNDIVTLDATSSSDPERQELIYTWTQISGPAVTLDSTNTASLQFTAPELSSTDIIVFQLSVSDGSNVSIDTVQVTIDPEPLVDTTVDDSDEPDETITDDDDTTVLDMTSTDGEDVSETGEETDQVEDNGGQETEEAVIELQEDSIVTPSNNTNNTNNNEQNTDELIDFIHDINSTTEIHDTSESEALSLSESDSELPITDIREFEQVLKKIEKNMWKELDLVNADMEDKALAEEAKQTSKLSILFPGVTQIMMPLSAGIITWVLRYSALFSSFFTSSSMIGTFDPLFILNANEKKEEDQLPDSPGMVDKVESFFESIADSFKKHR